jgi:hypothetical protein
MGDSLPSDSSGCSRFGKKYKKAADVGSEPIQRGDSPVVLKFKI